MRLVFDAHADLAWIALAYNRDITEALAEINRRELGMQRKKGWGDATSCLPEMRRGAIAVCLGTLFARTNRNTKSNPQGYLRTDFEYRTQSMPTPLPRGN